MQAIHKGLALISVIKTRGKRRRRCSIDRNRIKRISKFDLDKAQRIDALETDLAQVKHDLANLTDFATYFKHLKQTYGKGRERKQVRVFDDVDAKVVIRNTKLYVNREEGLGTSLRRDEYVTDCADIDDIIVFTGWKNDCDKG